MGKLLDSIKKEMEIETITAVLREISDVRINGDTRITFAFIRHISAIFLPKEIYKKVMKSYEYLDKLSVEKNG